MQSKQFSNVMRVFGGPNFRRLTLAVAVAVTLGCAGLECPKDDEDLSGVETGILLRGATTDLVPEVHTQGESFQFRTLVYRMNGETAGDMVTVTPGGPGGMTFTPPTREVAIPESGATEATFTANVGASVEGRKTLLYASRDRGTGATTTDDRSTYDDVEIQIISNLAAVTFTPSPAHLQRGKPNTITMSILPRGNAQGPVNLFLDIGTGAALYDVTPVNVNVSLVQGSTTPILRDIVVTPQHSAVNATLAAKQETAVVGAVQMIVGADPGDGDFSFTASKTAVTVAAHDLSEPVDFEIRSRGNFAGTVKVHWEQHPNATVSPTTNDVEYTLTAGASKLFVSRFYRFEDGGPASITWTATNEATGEVDTITIQVNSP